MMRILTSFLVLFVAIGFGLSYSRLASAQEGEIAKEVKQDDSASTESPSSILLTEDFTFTGALTSNGWTAHSGAGTNTLTAGGSGLTYSGYAGSGVGNAVGMTTSGEDVNKTFAVQSSGSVYAAVMVNLSDAALDASGGYFFHLGPDPISTTFRGRLYAKKDGSNNIAFGITKAGASLPGDISFTPFSYAVNTTYLLVIKYTIVDGATNDTVALFVNPALGGVEPAATVTAPDVAASDINPGSVALRQGSATTSPTLTADGIRVGNAWSDIAGGAGPSTTPPKLFKAYLNSSNEVPSNSSTATGFGRVVLNDAETQIKASFYWSGLTGNATAGHIHGPAAAGSNGPVIFNMSPSATTSGSVVDATFTVTPTDVANLKAGLLYFNIHTSANPGGEIRGQILVSKPRFDTDGDGDSDYGIVRPGPGGGSGQLTWYTTLSQGTGNDPFTINQWGLNSDVVTPGDFDGDGKTDIAFWRQTGTPAFFILRSSTGTLQQIVFGLPGDDPTIVADYDGDGKDNAAIYRPGATASAQSFFWNIHTSGPLTGVQVVQAWGLGSDLAVPGDYDGDGRADLCVTRGIGGSIVFIVNTSLGAVTYTTFGLSATDVVAPGDYDGDGKIDYAVTRVEGGTIVWYYRPSSGGPDVRFGWGSVAAGDVEAQGDYDGDGKTDIAIWRESGGSTFFVNASTGGTRFQRWGLAGDSPSIYDIH